MKLRRSLLLSCLIAFSFAHATANSDKDALLKRQGISLPPIGEETSTGSQETEAPSVTTPTITTPTTTEEEPITTPPTTTTLQPPTTTEPPQPTVQTSDTTPPETTTQPPAETQTTAPETTAEPITTESISTDANGGEVTVTQIVTGDTTSSAAPSTSSASSNNDDDSSGLGTGSIIGLSVAGGVAVIGIIAFFVWKFTRKRFSDFDDNEAIKWPELNAHNGTGGESHPLPVHNTGRSGFDTGSEVSLSRVNSTSTNTYSTPDLTTNDPYAIPPLPHLNPNQPYRDDPGNAYYDPYRGPVPTTFEEVPTPTGWAPAGGEAIAMTQMAGRASPGPQLAYGGDPQRVASPNPNMMRTTSPGPAAAYDMGRRSPGPNMAYGRSSPGPQVAYDQYGAPR